MSTSRAVELAWIVPTVPPEHLAIAVTVRTREGLIRETVPHGPKARDLAEALELAAAWVRALEVNF